VRAAAGTMTMGCGDACPRFPGTATRTRNSPTPGPPIDVVRRIRDGLKRRVAEPLLSFELPQTEQRQTSRAAMRPVQA